MHHKFFILLPFLTVLVLVASGCGGMHRYDTRLVEADSIMWDAPDSALVVLSAIDSLGGEADRAYRDLLMTQARYKCYQEITASDDSAITRAINHYRTHSGEREKLTRAYLYKGAVMEELGRVDSAMYYYKTAEANADEKDYTNLGQINTRIGDLFRLYYADLQICYDKYKQSLHYYQLTGNKPLQIASLISMGSCSGVIRNDDTEKLLNQATKLAIELNDSARYYICQELLCRQFSRDKNNLSRAKQIAFHCLNNYPTYINHDLILDLSDIYIKYRMPDSARFYLDMIQVNSGMANFEQVKTRKFLILSNIYMLEGDSARSSHYDMLSHQISDSILNSKQRYRIQEIENDKNFAQAEHRQQTIHGLRWLLRGIIALAVIALMALAFYHYRRVHRIKAIIEELKHTSINKHESLVQQDPQNSEISEFIGSLVAFMQTSIDSSQHDSPSVIRKRVQDGIGNITASEDFWRALKTHIDQNYDGLITRLAQNPRITDNDLKFIELCCCGFDYLEIAIVMDYTPKYISQKRKDVARKLHLRIPLQEYLENAMKGH